MEEEKPKNTKITMIFVVAVIIVLFVLMGVYSIYPSAGPSDDEEVIRIGVIGPLSGNFAYFGIQEQRGIELAAKQINNNHRNIELIYEDSVADPKNSVNAFNKLTNVDRVSFVLGDAWGGSTVPLVPLANEKRMILISPIATQNFLSEDDYFYRTIPTVDGMMIALAEYAYHDLSLRKIAILEGQNSYGLDHATSFKKSFESLGGEVVSRELIQLTETDVRTQLVKLNSKNPDAILNLGGGELFGLYIAQAIELGIDTTWLGHVGTENAPFLENYGSVSDRIYYPHPFNVDDVEDDFVDLFEEEYGERPNMVALNAYLALNILYEAIETVGEDSDDIKAYLDASEEFDENGDVKQTIYIKTIRNGKPVILD